LKFIGKETQRKIDLQIQTLQERVFDLENQLNISKNEMLAATKTLQQEKLDLEQANNHELNFSLEKAKTEKAAALHAAASEAEQKIGKLQSQLDTVQAEMAQLQATVEAAEAKNNSLSSQLAQANASLTEGQPKLAEALAKTTDLNAKLTDATTKLSNQSKELDKAKSELAEQLKKAEAATAANAASTKSLQAAKDQVATLQAANANANADADKKLQALSAKLADANKASAEANKTLADVKAQLAKQSDEALAVNNKLAQFQKDLSAANTAKAEAEKASQTVKTERDKQAKLAQQTEAKYQDSAQENELLLLQLMQAQEELVEYYEQKGEFEKLYLAYKARWDRLEKRLPNYLDYGVIEIEHVDGLSDVPSVTWKVKDFAQAGVALSEFSFQTTLQAGHPGIGLIQDGIAKTFVPKLLTTDKAQLATFMGCSTTEFRQINAAISILNQLESGLWKGFETPAQFDLGFWRPSLKALIAQVQSLPAVLRYDQVKLKRELNNTDYEHLWLEFHGLHFGLQHWKKFEIRLGAALVQPEGFSQYPKFEIPLIDGKTKPFDSWYAESYDDSGAKLELRFALDKKVFDVAVWTKLSEADRAFLLRLIYAMPEALKHLDAQKEAIHRPWKTWTQFAMGAVQILQASKKAPAKSADPVDNVKPSLPAPSVAALQIETPTPNKLQAKQLPAAKEFKDPKAGKVINITNKPAAAKKAMKAKP
jgi:predicted  nucleic acid-binding Zn-ribbon protein